jgi:hypothetical protein
MSTVESLEKELSDLGWTYEVTLEDPVYRQFLAVAKRADMVLMYSPPKDSPTMDRVLMLEHFITEAKYYRDNPATINIKESELPFFQELMALCKKHQVILNPNTRRWELKSCGRIWSHLTLDPERALVVTRGIPPDASTGLLKLAPDGTIA